MIHDCSRNDHLYRITFIFTEKTINMMMIFFAGASTNTAVICFLTSEVYILYARASLEQHSFSLIMIFCHTLYFHEKTAAPAKWILDLAILQFQLIVRPSEKSCILQV